MSTKHDSRNSKVAKHFFFFVCVFPCCSTHEKLYSHAQITTVGLILKKAKVISALRHKSKFNFDLFLKEIQNFGFSCCSSCKDLSIDTSITAVGLILTKPG